MRREKKRKGKKRTRTTKAVGQSGFRVTRAVVTSLLPTRAGRVTLVRADRSCTLNAESLGRTDDERETAMEFRVTIYADLYAPDGPNCTSSSSSSFFFPRFVQSNPTFPFAIRVSFFARNSASKVYPSILDGNENGIISSFPLRNLKETKRWMRRSKMNPKAFVENAMNYIRYFCRTTASSLIYVFNPFVLSASRRARLRLPALARLRADS